MREVSFYNNTLTNLSRIWKENERYGNWSQKEITLYPKYATLESIEHIMPSSYLMQELGMV